MKRETAKWVQKAEQDWEAAHQLAGGARPPRDVVCFHCQQATEKYLKGLLQENGLVAPRTHDLADIRRRELMPRRNCVRRTLRRFLRGMGGFRQPDPHFVAEHCGRRVV